MRKSDKGDSKPNKPKYSFIEASTVFYWRLALATSRKETDINDILDILAKCPVSCAESPCLVLNMTLDRIE